MHCLLPICLVACQHLVLVNSLWHKTCITTDSAMCLRASVLHWQEDAWSIPMNPHPPSKLKPTTIWHQQQSLSPDALPARPPLPPPPASSPITTLQPGGEQCSLHTISTFTYCTHTDTETKCMHTAMMDGLPALCNAQKHYSSPSSPEERDAPLKVTQPITPTPSLTRSRGKMCGSFPHRPACAWMYRVQRALDHLHISISYFYSILHPSYLLFMSIVCCDAVIFAHSTFCNVTMCSCNACIYMVCCVPAHVLCLKKLQFIELPLSPLKWLAKHQTIILGVSDHKIICQGKERSTASAGGVPGGSGILWLPIRHKANQATVSHDGQASAGGHKPLQRGWDMKQATSSSREGHSTECLSDLGSCLSHVCLCCKERTWQVGAGGLGGSWISTSQLSNIKSGTSSFRKRNPMALLLIIVPHVLMQCRPVEDMNVRGPQKPVHWEALVLLQCLHAEKKTPIKHRSGSPMWMMQILRSKFCRRLF